MLNGIGALMGGVFLGAVGAEILRRRCPSALNKLYADTRDVASGIKGAFQRGYENAAPRQEAAASD